MLPNAAERGLRQRVQQRLKQQLDQLRYSLSFVDALPQLAALGLIIGLVTGAVIVAFRLLIDVALALLLPGADAEFASLPPLARAALIGGGLVPICATAGIGATLWRPFPTAGPGFYAIIGMAGFMAADLAADLETAALAVLGLSQPVDLLEIPARRLTLAPIHETANLWEALEAMRASGAEGVYSARRSSPLAAAITGIVTQQSLNSYYQA